MMVGGSELQVLVVKVLEMSNVRVTRWANWANLGQGLLIVTSSVRS